MNPGHGAWGRGASVGIKRVFLGNGGIEFRTRGGNDGSASHKLPKMMPGRCKKVCLFEEGTDFPVMLLRMATNR